MSEETTEQVKRIPNPEGKGGFGEHPELINPGGRPKNSLKDYIRRKLSKMSDEEKEKWLIDNKISPELQFRMAEGNPHQTEDITSDGESVIPIYGRKSIQGYDSDKKDIPTEQENKSS